MVYSSSAATLRYQHVMAGRDAAIAAALDELIQAASARSEDSVAAGSGTRVARTGQHRRNGRPPMIGRDAQDLLGWLVGLPGLEPGTSSSSEINGRAPCYPVFPAGRATP
jgi:hypothetical protein